MRRRGAFFLATAAVASSSALGLDDTMAMVQHKRDDPPRRPAQTIEEAIQILAGTTPLPPLPAWGEYDEGMRMWLKRFYGMMREKGDETFLQCCALAKRQGILPKETWGDATEEEQEWWKESACEQITGADDPDGEPVGVPLCPQDTVLTKMLPPQDPDPFASLALELQDGMGIGKDGPGCDEEDRQELNASYIDRTKALQSSDQCQEFYIIRDGVKWDKLVPCVSQLHGVTYNCARCHVDFLKYVSGNNVQSDRGCLQKCMGLGACRDVGDCGYFVDDCAKCVQPAFRDYHRCIGGPIYNPITMQRLFEGMFLYHSA